MHTLLSVAEMVTQKQHTRSSSASVDNNIGETKTTVASKMPRRKRYAKRGNGAKYRVYLQGVLVNWLLSQHLELHLAILLII